MAPLAIWRPLILHTVIGILDFHKPTTKCQRLYIANATLQIMLITD